jgi:hypothetical protein
MHEGPLLILFVVVLGGIALCYGLLSLCGRIIVGVFRFCVGLVWPEADRATGKHRTNGVVCPNERCRNVEHRRASFCSHCGHPLPRRDRSRI